MTNVYSRNGDGYLESKDFSSDWRGYLIAISFALFIGFRPLDKVFVDMMNYNVNYYALAYLTTFSFDWTTENYLFDNLFYWLGSNAFDIDVFFVIIALLYFVGMYVAMRFFFPSNALYAYCCFLGAFSTFSYGTNGIKAGAAGVLFVIAIALRDKKIWSGLFLFASLGFHHSMILPILSFIISSIEKRTKLYLIFWSFCLLVAAAHITWFQNILGGMADERGMIYLNAIDTDWGGKTGFRYDFIIYSVFPIITSCIVIYKYKLQDAGLQLIFNIYLLTNGCWMLCMYAPFTNRIAYLSWIIYPVLLVYPFLSKKFMPNQVQFMNAVMWGQLIFTLMMNYVYYG